jgi:uncharacterized lipoprotein YmbA
MKRPNDSGAHAHKVGQPCHRNAPHCTGGSHCGRRARFAGRVVPHPTVFLMTFIVCACFTGCSFLKPAPDTARHFVLTPLPAAGPATVASGALGVGVGQVKIPAYLLNSSLAVRNGSNEIDYSPSLLWAERLDAGIPRVLAANLGSLLPADQIRLPLWRSEDVAAEIYVAIEQFDVSTSGQAVLIAHWRILSPGGEKILRTGESRLSRQGPSPESNQSGAVATLSELIADLSHQLARALKETTPALTHRG